MNTSFSFFSNPPFLLTVQARVQQALGPEGYNVHSFLLSNAQHGNGPIVIFEASLPNFPGDEIDFEVDLPGWPYENGEIDEGNIEILISEILSALRDSNAEEEPVYTDTEELTPHMPDPGASPRL